MTKFHRNLMSGLMLMVLAGACQRAPEQGGAVPQPQASERHVASDLSSPGAVAAAIEREEGGPAELGAAPAPLADEGRGATAIEAKGTGTPPVAMRALGQVGSGGALPKRAAYTAPAPSKAVQVAPAPSLEAPPGADTEAYDARVDTPFASVAHSPLSTFSIDVDTASYSNVRRFLAQGELPPSGAVRLEELINYFPYDYADPAGDAPLALSTEISVAPWNEKHRLLRVGLQGKRVASADLPPKNLVFLLDVSGSMESPNKLPLLRRSLATLTETLSERDQVAIVVYAGASGLVLPPTSGAQKADIRAALDRLQAGGSTNAGDGIELAYATAQRMARPGATSRVILATDGDFNVGVTSESELYELIESKRKSGVYLSVLGFGMGNYKDSTLELLADKGNGNYAYIDTLAEARKVLVAEAGATLNTLAKDVKLQLEFNPARVAAYRLIGYENRQLAARDFNDDAKDAGELGAGHNVTALYEIVPSGVAVDGGRVDPLRYQTTPAVVPGHTGELCTLKLRYKRPSSDRSELIERVVEDNGRALAATSPSFRFAAAVAAFGMTLRQSPERGSADFALARQLAAGAMGNDPDGYRREFLGLVDSAAALRR